LRKSVVQFRLRAFLRHSTASRLKTIEVRVRSGICRPDGAGERGGAGGCKVF
jgi:hypothetical protein